jgi:PAS domain S-box-containing protein
MGERILIVKDDPELVEFLLADVLLPNGYLAQAAVNGRAGLIAAQEKPPDLVLLDLSLQDVVYTEMLARLKRCGDPPVVMLTPSGSEAEALRAVRLGARDALVQPIKAEEAAAVVACVLHQERLAKERDTLVRTLVHSHGMQQQSLAEAQTLCDASKTVTSSLRLEDLLSAVVHAAISMTQAEEGYLILRDLESDDLYLRASRKPGDVHVTNLHVRVNNTIARQVIRSGKPVTISCNGSSSIGTRHRQTLDDASHLVRSVVYVPLYSQEQKQVIGVLGVANALCDRDFAESHTLLLAALADSAAIAIHNTQSNVGTDHTLSRVLAQVSAAQYRTDLILQNISEGVFTVDRDLRITSANAAMERITGWRKSELLGCRYEEVFAPQAGRRTLPATQTAPGKALHTRLPVPLAQSTVLRKDGRRISVTSMAIPLGTSDTWITGALAIMRDLAPETTLNHMCRETHDECEPHSLRLDAMIQEKPFTLHTEASSSAPHCHPVTLRPIINQVVKHFQNIASGSSFQVALAPDLPFAIGNESRIELALVNLIDNALVLSHPEHPIRISADASEDSVVIAVQGADLDEKHRQQSQPTVSQDSRAANHFSWWATPQVRLYIASKLIQAQGGTVWTENQSGTGTRFNLSLPKIEAQDVAEALID